MSTISLDKLAELAQTHFDENPELTEVYATQDGNIFYPNKLNLAKQHARVSNHKLHKISRSQMNVNVDDEEAEEEETPPTPPARKSSKKKPAAKVETLDPENRGE